MRFYFAKNTINYCFLQNKKLFGLVLSSSKGWGIISFQEIFFLVKNKELYSFLLSSKSYSSILVHIFFGFQKGYSTFLKLKGLGYKFIRVLDIIILKFGFSHRIIFINFLNVYCKYVTKYILFFNTRSFWVIKKLIQSFNIIRNINIYKKKGIFLKGSLITIKMSSKKSKF